MITKRKKNEMFIPYTKYALKDKKRFQTCDDCKERIEKIEVTKSFEYYIIKLLKIYIYIYNYIFHQLLM